MRDIQSQRLLETKATDASAMEELGEILGRECPAGTLIYLQGDLGAGKTTLVRGFLKGRGYIGRVKSPTYTLLEPYSTRRSPVYHFDLYRLKSPEELEGIGFRDYLDGVGICLIEWPEKAATLLPDPDLHIRIAFAEPGRTLTLVPYTQSGGFLVDTVLKTYR